MRSLRDYRDGLSPMKPRNTVAQAESCTRLTLDLIEHDTRFFLECEGRQVDGSHLGHAAGSIISTMCRPFRPAKQPRILFLGLGFGHAVKVARQLLPQEKSSFIVFPEAEQLPKWISTHLAEDPLDDPRVHLESAHPFAPLSDDYCGSQGIFADLDHLDALAPQHWSITSENVLRAFSERLKSGGLLGLISTRPIPKLDKLLRKVGFEVALDLAPLSENSKKNRTLYLARKGQYQRSH